MVEVARLEGQGMVSLRGDLSDKGLTATVAAKTGCAAPGLRSVVQSGTRTLCWMSPDELLLMAPAQGTAELVRELAAALAETHALVADVSNARATFVLTGQGVRDTLAKLSPMDVQSLPIGEMRRTRLAQVAAAFFLVSDTEARVICFRSVADYVEELLTTAAKAGAVLT